MNILVLNGSPKGERSNTLKLAKAFLEGFTQTQSADTEIVDIYKLNIRECLGCFACWSKTPGKCAITDAGREEFLHWLAAPNESISVEFKSAFLMKVFFSGNRTPVENAEMFRAFLDDCRAVLASMESIPTSVQRYSPEVPAGAPLYWQFDADFGYSYIKMCMEWAQRCIEKLEAMM